ncbi:hypothetical protein PXK30_05330 [Phaeobacter gallaeciensis]|uniref:hypothetical protein n=1 Tax=Phaeobacter gallaeciensis TaxID=60890 RepID=UPI00237F7F97|nr:hypothetical protein [Phaeobacter gallaeciensis]MDE4302846.1 hypothetical protein [Phaeobacter gallaeciensis]MDE4307061.1 hypothetical protein [Phaeobacter gallaeciensis]MDE4311526.1 hypothetical protein [Phaeobacter gallaeciensis]MDE4316167.1 hypothetical protein [Phaeobacter gallaeciensis]MDE4320453.1 hypothetical protein [Phaeobacter gallaeciensis]
MADPTFTAPPEVPNRDEHTNETYSSLMDAFLSWLAAFATELSAGVTWFAAQVAAVTTKAGEASDSAAAAAGYASAAEASAVAASAVADAWVSGGDYAAGETAYSPVDFQTYRAKTDHIGVATDPSADRTNWVLQGSDPTSARYFFLWIGG